MKLLELEPKLLVTGEGDVYSQQADNFERAQGIEFSCPKCKNHLIEVWFAGRNTPQTHTPRSGGWGISGTGLIDITISPSIDMRYGSEEHPKTYCHWHGFIQNGEIITV